MPLRAIKIVLILIILGCSSAEGAMQVFFQKGATTYAKSKWDKLSQLRGSIKSPISLDLTFSILDLGAPIDGASNARMYIQSAIDQCHTAGGGRVIIPQGEFLSVGPLYLRSNVNLHLEEGAHLKFSDDYSAYQPLVQVRWEGTVCWNWSPLIYANGEKNIAVTGHGEIDGNGRQWSITWREKQKQDKDRLRQMGNDLVPEDQRVFGNGFLDLIGDGQDDGFGDDSLLFLRPSLMEFYECENVLIKNLTLRNSPFWTLHPVFSKNITIEGLCIYGGYLNDDGIDPDSSEDILIDDCMIETHDDAIAIKAGRDQDTWHRAPCKNVIIQNCTLNSGVNAFAIGSEMSGGVQNVYVQDCKLLRGAHGLNFKTNLDRGGEVSDIFFRNLEIDTLREAMFIFRMDYHGFRGNHFPTSFRNFFATNINCNNAGKLVFKIVGVPDAFIDNIYLEDIHILHSEKDYELSYATNVILEDVYLAGQQINLP